MTSTESATVVETFLPRYDLKQFLDHQLRWARTIRDSRPGGYAGLVATFGLPWALVALICARGTGWASSPDWIQPLRSSGLNLRQFAAHHRSTPDGFGFPRIVTSTR